MWVSVNEGSIYLVKYMLIVFIIRRPKGETSNQFITTFLSNRVEKKEIKSNEVNKRETANNMCFLLIHVSRTKTNSQNSK